MRVGGTKSAMGQLQLFTLRVQRDSFACIFPCPRTSPMPTPDQGVTEAKTRDVWGASRWVSGAAPTTALAPLNKGEKPRPDRGSRSSKEKAIFNTYHCCSKSQSLKKSNRSIAAGRRLAAVCPSSLCVDTALSCAALTVVRGAALWPSRPVKSAGAASAIVAGSQGT